jgi:tRNA pseudouridine38-40 synthase
LRTLKLTLAYDGTAYAGWQSQRNQTTLQDTFEAALAQVTGESIRVLASGRTDAGVHALGQVVSFQTAGDLPPATLQRALNAVLPNDMAVLESVEAPADFHATWHAVSKRYRYTIHDGRVGDVFRRGFVWHCRRRLDAQAMHRAAQALVGKHDFRSFESAWPQRNSSVRTIFEISVARGLGAARQTPPGPMAGGAHAASDEDLVTLEVEADGFLYNMVRAIVGTLVEVGRGVQNEAWPSEVLAACDRGAAGMTVPPQGLCLLQVEYREVK